MKGILKFHGFLRLLAQVNFWMIDRAFVLVPIQAVASKFLLTLKDFPPSQKPGDWSLDSLEKQIKGMTVGGE
jgi:arylsulfatase